MTQRQRPRIDRWAGVSARCGASAACGCRSPCFPMRLQPRVSAAASFRAAVQLLEAPLLARLGADTVRANQPLGAPRRRAERRVDGVRRREIFVCALAPDELEASWASAAAAPRRGAARRRWGPRRCTSALRGTCFSRRFGRWEPGPVGGMGVGFGEGA